MNEFMLEAIAQAKKSLSEGGIPIGAVIEIDGKIVGRGHNQRVQNGSPILHGEMSALENAGRYRRLNIEELLYILHCRLAKCAAEQFYYIKFQELLSLRIVHFWAMKNV